jgi:hypothetical protein
MNEQQRDEDRRQRALADNVTAFARAEVAQFAAERPEYFRPGDVVEQTYNGAVRRVIRHNRRKVLIEDENGRRSTIDPRGLRRTDKPFELAADALTAPEDLVVGSLVRLNPSSKIPFGYGADTLFAVLVPRPTPNQTVRIAKLGGDANRYITAPVINLIAVDPKEVLS